MPTSQIPAFIDALYDQITAAFAADQNLSEVIVYDGYGPAYDVGDYLMIGIEDPTSTSESTSASATQAAATLGTSHSRDENGTVTIAALSFLGDVSTPSDNVQKIVRDRVFEILAAIEGIVRADPSMGLVAGGLFVASMGESIALDQNVSDQGTDAALIFSISYRARI